MSARNTNQIRRDINTLVHAHVAPGRAEAWVGAMWPGKYETPYSTELLYRAIASKVFEWTQVIAGHVIARLLQEMEQRRIVPVERVVRRGRPLAAEAAAFLPSKTDRERLRDWQDGLRVDWRTAERPRVHPNLDTILARHFGNIGLSVGSTDDAARMVVAIDVTLAGVKTRVPEAASLVLASLLTDAFEDLTGAPAGMGILERFGLETEGQGLPHGPFARFIRAIESVAGIKILGTDWGLFRKARKVRQGSGNSEIIAS